MPLPTKPSNDPRDNVRVPQLPKLDTVDPRTGGQRTDHWNEKAIDAAIADLPKTAPEARAALRQQRELEAAVNGEIAPDVAAAMTTGKAIPSKVGQALTRIGRKAT